MKIGTVVEWIRKEGEIVEKGKPLFSLDTEKVVVEIESPASGILRNILVREGTTVPIGGLIAIIAEENELLPDLDSLVKEAEQSLAHQQTIEHTGQSELTPLHDDPLERIPVSPSARKLAREHNIDISKLTGTGRGGRIQREDVLRVVDATPTPMPTHSEIETTIPLNSTRRAIIDRLSASYSNALHVTLQQEADFSGLKSFRDEFPAQHGGKRPSYTDLLVKAVALTLRKIRILNSIFEDDQIKIIKDINVGIAVSLENGLVVPVVKNADKKNLEEIMSETERLVESARSGKLKLNDVSGGTFTITNLGTYTVDSFDPIINPPEAAILAVGRITDKPTVVDGQISIRPIGILSLAFDHRIIDGAGASQFLRELGTILANPRLLVN